jgi:hypothetical protein
MGGPVADTEALAQRLIEEFDEDGDGALNQAELAEAIKTVHERSRRAQGQGAGGARLAVVVRLVAERAVVKVASGVKVVVRGPEPAAADQRAVDGALLAAVGAAGQPEGRPAEREKAGEAEAPR